MTLSQTPGSKTKISLKFKMYAYVRCIQWQYTWRMHNKFTTQYSKFTNMLTFKLIFVVQIDAWNMYVIVKGCHGRLLTFSMSGLFSLSFRSLTAIMVIVYTLCAGLFLTPIVTVHEHAVFIKAVPCFYYTDVDHNYNGFPIFIA